MEKKKELSEMDLEAIIKRVNEIVEKMPPKASFEKCMVEIICEKNKLLENENLTEKDKKLIEEYDKVVQRIQQYLSVATK
jgi:hypothetical protein